MKRQDLQNRVEIEGPAKMRKLWFVPLWRLKA
jgi:hypothetical protein